MSLSSSTRSSRSTSRLQRHSTSSTSTSSSTRTRQPRRRPVSAGGSTRQGSAAAAGGDSERRWWGVQSPTWHPSLQGVEATLLRATTQHQHGDTPLVQCPAWRDCVRKVFRELVDLGKAEGTAEGDSLAQSLRTHVEQLKKQVQVTERENASLSEELVIVRGNVGRLTEENHRLRDQMEFEMQSSLNTISGSESLSMLREAHRSLVDSNRQLLSENARLREQQEDEIRRVHASFNLLKKEHEATLLELEREKLRSRGQQQQLQLLKEEMLGLSVDESHTLSMSSLASSLRR